MHNNFLCEYERPTGSPQAFLIHKGEIVRYDKKLWTVEETFRRSGNIHTNEEYSNDVFTVYNLSRYEGLRKIVIYLTQDDIPDVVIPSGVETYKSSLTEYLYSKNYLKLSGK